MNAPAGGYKPLFVCGSPKSGTTWLQKVLDAHPLIACAGEGHFVEQIVLPMMRMFNDYNGKLKQVDERVFEGQAPYQPLNQAEMLPLIRSVVGKLMLRQGPAANVQWLGDKTPRYTENLRELRILFPSARFLHIVRDPRDVAVSLLFHAKRAGYDDALTPGSDDYYRLVGNAANAWTLHNANVDTFVAAKAEDAARVHQISYEALKGDFDTVMTALFAFLDVDNSPAVIAKIHRSTDFATLSGRKHGEEDATSFFRKGVVGDWKERLDKKALDIIETRAGPLMRAKGYQAA